MRKSAPTLADVDGSTPGRAVLLLVDVENPGGPFCVPFTEGEHGCTNPRESCEALWESIRGDWPTRVPAIAANRRADYLIWKKCMQESGIADVSPAAFVALFA